ncbi:MAG: hypothetical protein H7Y00_06605 [Fimbriimonadaceae bacterium]|nr:hypothetical protein [Chitinophagales bacterium]
MSEIKNKPEQEAVKQNDDLYRKVENTFLKNRNVIIGALVLIIVGIGGYFGYKELFLKPKTQQADNKISYPQNFFTKDSFQLALNGDGINGGFLQIADDYGMTKSGNLAKYYAGVCYLKAKDFDSAIKYFEDYKPKTDELAGLTYILLCIEYAEKNVFA